MWTTIYILAKNLTPTHSCFPHNLLLLWEFFFHLNEIDETKLNFVNFLLFSIRIFKNELFPFFLSSDKKAFIELLPCFSKIKRKCIQQELSIMFHNHAYPLNTTDECPYRSFPSNTWPGTPCLLSEKKSKKLKLKRTSKLEVDTTKKRKMLIRCLKLKRA